jgi:hypothetical protein
MTPSRSARRFRSWLLLRLRIRRALRNPAAWRSAGGDLFTIIALVMVGLGLAMALGTGWGLLVVGLLLLLLTPVGVAFRILIRGK